MSNKRKITSWELRGEELKGGHPYRRPVDAATLLIYEPAATGPLRLLLGRRHMSHKFMPGKYVFPGGRVDAGDSRITVERDYHPQVLAKLMTAMKGPKTAARARAFGVAAIRETYEEAGLLIGTRSSTPVRPRPGWEAFAERRLAPDLADIRVIARAITPPGRIRRFDSRFLALPASAITDRLPSGTGPSGELEQLKWMTVDEAFGLDLPTITKIVLVDLENRLKSTPQLDPGAPVSFFFVRNWKFKRETL
jgi:8-oxo-dGTP pyrophosphatase MutT (NUDIX family)